jgi:pyridoxine kinase
MNVLSIQSHVAFGYVGNRAAAFPLQRLGMEVWAINTVQFSNHTGYGVWSGQVFGPAHIRELVDGIDRLGVLGQCDAVLTGYLGDAELGQAALEAVARVRAANPKALYCCDPVMGDHGRGLFVRAGIPELFRDRIVQLADILTPNQFELEYLAGGPLGTLEAVLAATTALRQARGAIVLVTSLHRRDAPPGTIEMLAHGDDGAFLVATPMIDFATPPNGSGDTVAALFLAHRLAGDGLGASLEAAAAGIFAVMQETARQGRRELALIAAQEQLAGTARPFKARRLAMGGGA